MNYIEQDKYLEFSRSIIKGVEIKLCRNNVHAYKSHVHKELSLGYIADGSTELMLNNTIIHYKAGDGVIIPPLMTHKCNPNDINHWAYVMLFVEPNYYSDYIRFHKAKKLTGNQVQKLTGFIERLMAEKNPDALENILIELLLEYSDEDIAKTYMVNSDHAIKTIHEYIISHVKDEITLDMLMQLSGLNKFTLIRNFKKHYITTPSAYHLQYRVAEGKRLLSQGADVFDICEELRFYDQSHFIREFKKMYGVTPGAYTEQLRV